MSEITITEIFGNVIVEPNYDVKVDDETFKRNAKGGNQQHIISLRMKSGAIVDINIWYPQDND